MKAHHRVVVIGGGVVGASVLYYHLAKVEWSDVALVEKQRSDSTWNLVTEAGLSTPSMW
jgi:dimethylglycine dehydrogenase